MRSTRPCLLNFKYDPFGRRIYKSSSSTTSIYAYDGDNLVEETNSSGGAVARYSQGLNIDEPLAMLRSGTTNFYNADGLGTITSATSYYHADGLLGRNFLLTPPCRCTPAPETAKTRPCKLVALLEV